MIFADELKNGILYKKKFLYPIDDKDKRHGSTVLLMSPNIESSKKLMGYPLVDSRYYKGYYIDKSVMAFIQ